MKTIVPKIYGIMKIHKFKQNRNAEEHLIRKFVLITKMKTIVWIKQGINKMLHFIT